MNGQAYLKKDALQIIRKLNLLNILSKYGEARLVGSVPLNLIVKLDIDVHVYIGKNNLVKTANAIYPILLNNKNISEIRICDYRHKSSIKIGIDNFTGASGNWSIDIWLTKNKKMTGFEQTDRILSKLNPEQRQIILKIKRFYFIRKLLRNSLSLKIYNAVLDNNITSVKDFKKMYSNIA